jgi:hypothetical protein
VVSSTCPILTPTTTSSSTCERGFDTTWAPLTRRSAPGFGSTSAFQEHMLGAVETLLAEGRAGKPKMVTIGE